MLQFSVEGKAGIFEQSKFLGHFVFAFCLLVPGNAQSPNIFILKIHLFACLFICLKL